MRFSTAAAAATAFFASSVLAKDVACVVEGQEVAVVDLDTGNCPFTIPANLPVAFEYVSLEEYNVEWYYTIANNERFRTDIRNAGRVIEVPARFLYGTPGAPLFQVHLEKEPASNSTAAIRRRLMKEIPIAKRDEVDDFVASIEDTDGTPVDGGDFALQVVDVNEASSASEASEPTLTSTGSGVDVETSGSVTGAPQSTVTTQETAIITITSCHNGVCKGTTVPGTLGPVTTTVSGTTTIYTTYCPISSYESVEATKVITITSCSNNACHETSVTATPSTTETVIGGVVTEYVTYCPITEEEGKTTTKAATTQGTVTEESTKVITVTSCHNDVCKGTTVPATLGPVTTTVSGTTTVYTTYCPVSSVQTVESTKVITAVVCKEEKCHETTVEATPSTTSGTVAGKTTEVTEYVTYCPVSTPSGESVATKVVTSEGSVYVPKTVEVTSEGTTYETTKYLTVSKTTPGATEAATTKPATTAAPAETTEGGKTLAEVSVIGSSSAAPSAAISTYAGSAATSGASFLALALIPLAYFF
jgi:hypothetical protein